MELIFQEKKIQYLRQILNESVFLEQTADLIVPDSLSDIDRVVDAHGTAILRSADCTALGVSTEGTVQAGALFVGQDGQLHNLSVQIPFSARKDFATQQENCSLQCKCTLRNVEARMLNSRKLLIRVGIVCELAAYAPKELCTYDIDEPAPQLQLRRQELPLTLPLTLGEKNFTIHEELELPNEKPSLDRLLKCLCRMQIDEQKTLGEKAVFKGNLIVHALYESAEGKPVVHEWSVPFSQYAQLPQELDEAQLRTQLSLTSFDVEPDSLGDCRRLLLSAGLLAQCIVYGKKSVCVIDDAFCTDALLTPEFHPERIDGILDCQTLRENLISAYEEPTGGLVDVWMYFDETEKQRTADEMELSVFICCNVMYYDEKGQIQSVTLRPRYQTRVALSDHANCSIVQLDGGEIFAAAGTNGIELRLPITMRVESTAEHDLQVLCGGHIEPLPPEEGKRPSAILRRLENCQELWQVAKTYRTSMQTIMEANDLHGECVPENTMLLIPL
ncbi:MAG: hypothetical protein E7467_07050 [Ruminococcaceae bacterium]|nr:hypothetical protein [Oscillospiraceae bacterium]